MSRLLFMLPMTLMALSAQAEPSLAECEARAARVVDQLNAQSALPLTRSEERLAYGAALESCMGEARSADAEPMPAEPQGSRFERFVAGLFSMDTQMARTRLGGKYRYLEKED
jgi:hypothetical protein